VQAGLINTDLQQYGPAYLAEVAGATIRIYKEKIIRETEYEEKYWNERVVLEIRPEELGDFVRIPATSGLDDLYESVIFKTGKLDRFLDNFLKEG
jgi:hypothetical protein